MQAKTLIILCAAAVSACAAPWHKPGGTKAEFDETLSACQLEAQHAVPVALAYAVAAGSSFSASNCKGGHCAEYSSYIPPTINSYDANTGQRDQYVWACLFRNGWSDQSQ